MMKPDVLPRWNEPMFTMDQASRVLGRPRSTLTGHIARYKALGIEAAVSGSTRRISIGQLTALAFARQLIGAGIQPGAVDKCLRGLLPYAETLFATVQNAGFGYNSDVRSNDQVTRTDRLYAYDLDLERANFAAIIVSSFTDESPDELYITDQPATHTGLVRDLQGFPLPSVVLPLDDLLRLCWARCLTVANGGDLDAR